MSLESIASRLTGWIPRLPKSEAYNLVGDAWTDIRNDRLWSFQLVEDSVSTPNVINVGTCTAMQGSNQVTLDSVASAAVTGLTLPLLTQRQFRITSGAIYSIIAADFTVPAAVVLTLDRLYTDPTAAGSSYQIMWCYVTPPVADFKRWIDWRDMTNGDWLSIYMTRRELNMGDPQRLYYTFPHWVVGMGVDNRGAGTQTPSATLGYPMYELYPNPLSVISYMRWWIRSGADLVNLSDTAPYPITDKLLQARAMMLACRWAESNRDPSIPRGQAADYKFLYQSAAAEYALELKLIGLKDRDLVDLFLAQIPRERTVGLNRLPYYSTISGRAYYGG